MPTWRIIVATGLRHACIMLAVLATLAFGGDIHVHQVTADAPDTCLAGHGHANPSLADADGDEEGTSCGHCDCLISTSTLPEPWAGLAQTTAHDPRLRPGNDPTLPGLNHQPDPPPVQG